jgi:hypothetical protein
MAEPSVATVVETHSKLDTITIEVDNHMAIIQIQVGKNIVEDVLIDGGTSVNKVRFIQTKTGSIPLQNGRS